MLLFIVGGLASVFVLLVLQRRLASKPRNVNLTFNGFPSRSGSFLGILLNLILKRQGRFFPGFKDVPKIEFVIENAECVVWSYSRTTFGLQIQFPCLFATFTPLVTALSARSPFPLFCSVQKREYSIYERLVTSKGTPESDTVMPCFIPALMFKVWARLTSLPEWPLSPLGLIHYKTVITQWKEIKVGEPLRVEVRFDGSRNGEKGIEIDADIKAFDGTGERVLECVWTVLSRGGRASGAKKTAAAPPAESSAAEDANVTPVECRSGLGVSFSTATGDISPQHMYPITASLIGFKKPIAHGMWTLERAISDIREKGALPKLPITLESYFKLPIFLPGKVNVCWTKAGDKIEYRVASADGKPHLTGHLQPARK